jgi:hypothetical protein
MNCSKLSLNANLFKFNCPETGSWERKRWGMRPFLFPLMCVAKLHCQKYNDIPEIRVPPALDILQCIVLSFLAGEKCFTGKIKLQCERQSQLRVAFRKRWPAQSSDGRLSRGKWLSRVLGGSVERWVAQKRWVAQ